MERRLLRTAVNELVAAQDQMLLLGRKTARERIATFLLAQSVPPQPCTPPRAGFHLPMNRTDIADYLGLTIETVSRTMSWMRGQRLIALPAVADVVILDRRRLSAIATGMASPD
jgi:CRP/FNR family transcriptional regulator